MQKQIRVAEAYPRSQTAYDVAMFKVVAAERTFTSNQLTKTGEILLTTSSTYVRRSVVLCRHSMHDYQESASNNIDKKLHKACKMAVAPFCNINDDS